MCCTASWVRVRRPADSRESPSAGESCAVHAPRLVRFTRQGSCGHGRKPAQRARLAPVHVRDLIDQEAAKNGKAVEEAASEVGDGLQAVQAKLNRLTRALLDEVIDEESYQAAKADLVSEKARLKQEKTRLQKTGESYWVEPAKAYITTLEQAGLAQGTISPEEISGLVQKLERTIRFREKK